MRALSILFILLAKVVCGQQGYFNNRLFHEGYDYGYNIQEFDSGFDLVYAYTDSSLILNKFQYVKIDFNGSVISTTDYICYPHSYYVGGFGGLIVQDSASLIMVGSTTLYGSADPILYTFNYFGDTISTNVYVDSLFQSGWHVVKNRSKGYLIVGQTTLTDPNSNVFLLAIDSNKNFLWKKEFGGTGWEIGQWVDTTIDGGIVIAGRTLSYGAGAGPGCANMYIIKTDSAGNLIWMKNYGGQYYDMAFVVLQCKDSSLAVAGSFSTFSTLASQDCSNNFSQPWILKLDQSGNIIWERKYGQSFYETSIVCMRELINGDLIATGYAGNDSLLTNNGFILKVRSNGDSVFYNFYQNISGYNSENYLSDIRPTRDGGYIACGAVAPFAPDTGSQDAWILKIDSNGCEVANCTVGLNEKLNGKREINIYPIPFINVLNILVEEPVEKFDIEIYNILGRRVFEKAAIVTKEYQINTANFQSGIYFISIKEKGRQIYSGKIIRN